MAEPPLVDPARLRALRADYGAVAAELVDVYATTAAGTVAELRAALAADDREEVRRLARNVGATGMAELAGALEAGPSDPAAALDRLACAVDPTCAALRGVLAD